MECMEFDTKALTKDLKEDFAGKKIFLTPEDWQELSKAAVMIMNRLHLDIPFNANITFCSDDIEISNQYGEAFGEWIEKTYPESVALVNGNSFYALDQMAEELKGRKVIVVKNLMVAEPEKLFTALTDIEKEGWKVAVIICTETASLETIKECRERDQRLFHYLLGFKFIPSDIDVSNVSGLVRERLKYAGYELNDVFCRKLDVYVKAVYPQAVLTRQSFIEDLIYRIYQVHYQKTVQGNRLDETDVPYSVKAEKLWKDVQEDKMADEPEAYLEEDKGYSAVKEDGAKTGKLCDERVPYEYKLSGIIPSQAEVSERRHTAKVQEKDGQIKEAGIFLVLSKYNERNEVDGADDYQLTVETTGNRRFYKGEQTNDAPVQYLIDEVCCAGYQLKKIVCVNTPEVMETKNRKNVYERFQKLIEEYMKAVWPEQKAEVDYILYKQAESDDKTYFNFYKQLNEKAGGLDAFYVDYTGGLRDTSFLMVAAIKFLEFKGINCEKVVYSDFFAKPQKQLKVLDKAYNLFQMINGMGEFVSSGTTRQLDDYVFNKENDLITAVRHFSHATNVGDVVTLDRKIKELNYALDKADHKEELNSLMIESMREVIRNKIFGMNQKNPLISEEKKINYYRLIDWCMENKMYQQAATLYIEKVPVMYWENNIISELVPLSRDAQKGSSNEVKTFYADLTEWMMFGSELTDIRRVISSIEVPLKDGWDLSVFLHQLTGKFSKYNVACRRLKQIIEGRYFDYYGNTTEAMIVCEGVEINQKDIGTFISSLKGDRQMHYYLLNGKCLPKEENNDKARTLNRIRHAFENADTAARTNDDRKLCKLMALYLAVKLLRNKMSHASEINNEEENVVISGLERFLKEELGCKAYRISLEEDAISGLLAEAVEASKAAKDPFITAEAYRKIKAKESTKEANETEKEIQDIEIPDMAGDITDSFRRYLQIVIYMLRSVPDKSMSLADIKQNTPVGLPEKRTLTEEGKKSGIKLITEKCSSFIRVEGIGENAVLTYFGK